MKLPQCPCCWPTLLSGRQVGGCMAHGGMQPPGSCRLLLQMSTHAPLFAWRCSSACCNAEEGSREGAAATGMLSSLVAYSQTLWPDLASGDLTVGSSGGGSGGSAHQQQQEPLRGQPAPPGSTAADFEAWAGEQGVAAAISIASFGGMRGCAATRDVAPGERLLSIPAEVLIYEDTVLQTDLVRGAGGFESIEWLGFGRLHGLVCRQAAATVAMQCRRLPVNLCAAPGVLQGRMLHAIPGLTIDNLLIIWTMVDRSAQQAQHGVRQPTSRRTTSGPPGCGSPASSGSHWLRWSAAGLHGLMLYFHPCLQARRG